MEVPRMKEYTCLSSVFACLLLSVIYVASLYVWNSPPNRDHPSTIKKRFFSVFLMMFISPLFLYCFLTEDTLKNASLFEVMGLRWPGLIPATLLPLLLTMVLFLGPLTMQGFSGLWKLYVEPMFWFTNLKNLIWLRNHVVAPLSEEFTFRACMLPLLLQCFPTMTAIFVCPLFFGIAHFHHMVERVKGGLDVTRALILSCFQFSYTTLFGAYSAFLFVRTGHFMAPFIAHAFCNHMGFPDFSELLTHKDPNRIILMTLFLVGLVAWCFLLTPLTSPYLYSNQFYFKMH